MQSTSKHVADQRTDSVRDTSNDTLPALNPGEVYVGIIEDDQYSSRYHLILLPGQAKKGFGYAFTWALDQGGRVPKEREMDLLYNTVKDQFEAQWHWANDVSILDDKPTVPMAIHFGTGQKEVFPFNTRLVARAIRRVPIPLLTV